MPQDTLRHGFVLAYRRIGLIFVDLLWKAIWLAMTVAAGVIVVMWFTAPLRAIQWQQSNIPGVNALLVARLFQQLWLERGSELMLAAFGVLCFSVIVRFVLEASFRSRILPSSSGSKVFLVSNAIKTILLATATATLGILVFGRYMATPISEWPALWPETRGAALAAIAAFLALAFVLTIIDTLVRCDAIELFGTELLHVSTVIGVLVLFESMIRASLAIAIGVGFLNISGASDAVVMIGVAFLAVLFWTLIHSYLLLVRFSAVGIMRRNVVDI